MFDLSIVVIIFIFGMCIGSFLNVCIYRLPESKSIADPPRSICQSCNSHIRFYDNIPVVSYLLLKGRCRHCDAPISFRYPLVEVMSGTVAISLLFTFGLSLEGLVYFVFISSLLVITFIDIDHKIIPDIISLPGIPIGLVASFALPTVTFKDSAIGLLIGGGSLFTIFAASTVGSCVGIAVMLIKGKDMKFAIPFGPFLSIGAIAYIFFGSRFLSWYFY